VVAQDFLDYIPDKKKAIEFLWEKTAKINEDGSVFEEEHATDEQKEEAIPVALAVLQAKITNNLQNIFKIAVAEDPGEFILGNVDYWKAMESGNWTHLAGTFSNYLKQKKKK
jgi:hypothetical protein